MPSIIILQLNIYKVRLYIREITNLRKIYTKEIKYSSSRDSFDYKFKIFLDYCKLVSILKDNLINVILTMFKGYTLEYFYTYKFRTKGYFTINTIINIIKANYKGPKHKINNL